MSADLSECSISTLLSPSEFEIITHPELRTLLIHWKDLGSANFEIMIKRRRLNIRFMIRIAEGDNRKMFDAIDRIIKLSAQSDAWMSTTFQTLIQY